jgi:hypothetical protein
MLNFGGYAQIYTDRYADSLANSGVDETETVTDFDAYAPTVTGTLPDGISYYGMSVVLDSYMRVRHYFKVESGTEIPDGLVPSGEYYYAEIDGFTAIEYADVNTYTVGNMTISYSVLSYCYLANRNSPTNNMQMLISAMYNYYVQACEYKAKI